MDRMNPYLPSDFRQRLEREYPDLDKLAAVALRSLQPPTLRRRLANRWYAFWRRVLLGGRR